MTRQLDVEREARQDRRDKALVKALEFGLEGAVAHAGGELTGFTVKISLDDCLMVVKAIVAGRSQVAFVGASSIADCILKAEREAKADKLRWRADKFAQPGD